MSTCHVSEVDWANPNISRASVIPYFEHGEELVFGFGISSTSNITTVGGKFEDTDFDLLDTAKREVFEEVGLEMKDEILFSSSAIQTQGNVAILYEVQGPFIFAPSDEIKALFWLTKSQLISLRKAKVWFSYDALEVFDELMKYENPDSSFIVPIRSQKVVKVDRKVYGIGQFQKDLDESGNWQMIVGFTQNGTVYMKRADGRIYCITIDNFNLLSHKLAKHQTRFMTLGTPAFKFPVNQIKLTKLTKSEKVDEFLEIYKTTTSPLYKLEALCGIELLSYKAKSKKKLTRSAFILTKVATLVENMYMGLEDTEPDDPQVRKWAMENDFI